jgi:hypothetical protein
VTNRLNFPPGFSHVGSKQGQKGLLCCCCVCVVVVKDEKIIFILFESRSRMCVNSNLIEKKFKYDGQGKKRGILGALTYELLIGGFH